MNRLLFPVALSLAAPAAIAQCTIQAPGTVVAVANDNWSIEQSIGFQFPFAGNTYTGAFISDHGLVALTNAGTPPAPAAGAFTYTVDVNSLVSVGPLIASYWSDHWVNNGSVSIDNTSGSYCTITWFDAETYLGQQPPFTVQVTLHDDGRVVICLDDRVSNSGSTFGGGSLNAIIGLSPGGPAALPAASDLSAGPATVDPTIFEEWTTTAPMTPNPLFDVANSVLTFIPTTPGWVVVPDTLACASKAIYGTGCDGVTLDSNTPVIGTNWDLTLNGLTTSPVGIFYFGSTRVDPGLPFAVIGFNSPGCNVHIDGLVGSSSATTTPNFTATVSIAVPLNATLKGAILTAQGVALTLNPAFPSNLVSSNGLEGVIGY